jgi:hypothetical protein
MAAAGVSAASTVATLCSIVVMWKTWAADVSVRLAKTDVEGADAVDASRDALIGQRDDDNR